MSKVPLIQIGWASEIEKQAKDLAASSMQNRDLMAKATFTRPAPPPKGEGKKGKGKKGKDSEAGGGGKKGKKGNKKGKGGGKTGSKDSQAGQPAEQSAQDSAKGKKGKGKGSKGKGDDSRAPGKPDPQNMWNVPGGVHWAMADERDTNGTHSEYTMLDVKSPLSLEEKQRIQEVEKREQQLRQRFSEKMIEQELIDVRTNGKKYEDIKGTWDEPELMMQSSSSWHDPYYDSSYNWYASNGAQDDDAAVDPATEELLPERYEQELNERNALSASKKTAAEQEGDESEKAPTLNVRNDVPVPSGLDEKKYVDVAGLVKAASGPDKTAVLSKKDFNIEYLNNSNRDTTSSSHSQGNDEQTLTMADFSREAKASLNTQKPETLTMQDWHVSDLSKGSTNYTSSEQTLTGTVPPLQGTMNTTLSATHNETLTLSDLRGKTDVVGIHVQEKEQMVKGTRLLHGEEMIGREKCMELIMTPSGREEIFGS